MGAEDTENQQSQTADISPRLKLVVNERVAVIIKVVQKEVMQVVLHDVIKSVSLENINPFTRILNRGSDLACRHQKLLGQFQSL